MQCVFTQLQCFTVDAVAEELAVLQRVAGSIPARNNSLCDSPNDCFGSGCQVHVCKRNHDSGEIHNRTQ